MISSRTAAILLGSASLGLVAATAGPAGAHPGEAPSAENGEVRTAPDRARPERGRPGQGARQCNIAPAKLLTAENNDRLKAVDERLDAQVAAGEITQEQADARFERHQQRVTIKVAMRTAKLAPMLTLFGMENAAALRTAVKDAGGIRALIEATGVEVKDVHAARKAGRTAAHEVRAELCNSGDDTTEEAPSV